MSSVTGRATDGQYQYHCETQAVPVAGDCGCRSTVKATFGKDSSVVKWVVLAEVLVGAVMYMMTKNVKFLAGFAIISVFIAVGMAVVGLK